jgi:hypothetical protein
MPRHAGLPTPCHSATSRRACRTAGPRGLTRVRQAGRLRPTRQAAGGTRSVKTAVAQNRHLLRGQTVVLGLPCTRRLRHRRRGECSRRARSAADPPLAGTQPRLIDSSINLNLRKRNSTSCRRRTSVVSRVAVGRAAFSGSLQKMPRNRLGSCSGLGFVSQIRSSSLLSPSAPGCSPTTERAVACCPRVTPC